MQPETTSGGLERFPRVETHLLRSKHVAQTFKVDIALPALRMGEIARFPVVYASEGNRTFDMYKGISQILQTSVRDAPRFVLVGVGYPSESPRAGAVLRGRDLAFPGYPKFDMTPPPAEGVLTPECGTHALERAEDFQLFIGEELVPFIDDNYSTVPNDRTFVGHSLGGAFGLFTLFGMPELFNRYIVSSPGLSFNGRTTAGLDYDNYDFMFDHARKFIDSAPNLSGVRLYMSVGDEEEFEQELEPWRLTSSFYRMAALLKRAAIPGLEVLAEVFPGETHTSVCPMAYVHGIKAVFGRGRWNGRCAGSPSCRYP